MRGFDLFGVTISWYGVIIAISMLVAIILCLFICKKRNLKKEDIFTLALWVIPLAVLGARIYYVATSGQTYSFAQFWDFRSGGMAIYGGVIGGALGVLIHSLIKKQNFFAYADVVAPCLILAQGIGRIGCYFGGCCYGIETTNEALQVFPLSVFIHGKWHLATFFYESFFNVIGFVVLLLILFYVKKKSVPTACYFIYYGTVRAILETFRDPAETLYLFGSSLKVSQFLSILLIALGVAMLLYVYIKDYKNKKNQNIEKTTNEIKPLNNKEIKSMIKQKPKTALTVEEIKNETKPK